MFVDASQPVGQIVHLSDDELEELVRKALTEAMPGKLPLCACFGDDGRGGKCVAHARGNFFSLCESDR